jgi:hypothetical protein
MKLDASMTLAGIWTPVSDNNYINANYTGALSQTQQALIKLDATGRYGLVVSGWGSTGKNTSVPLSLAILSPASGNTLVLNTSAYIKDSSIHMSNSIIVADFNADGQSDIFLPAYQEGPFLPASSTLFLSNSNGSFTKTTVNDLEVVHDAEVFTLNGTLKVFTASFNQNPNLNPVYQFSNGSLSASQPSLISGLTGLSTTIIDNGPQIGLELILGHGAPHLPRSTEFVA